MNKNRRPGGKENSMKDSIKALRELEKRLYAYQYAMAVADYDSETVAPPESSAGRAEAMEVLSRAYFDQLVSADTAALLQRAAADAETEQEKAEVRELQRSYDEIGKIPAEEYAAFTNLTQESTVQVQDLEDLAVQKKSFFQQYMQVRIREVQ